jgi:hypothetical protein
MIKAPQVFVSIKSNLRKTFLREHTQQSIDQHVDYFTVLHFQLCTPQDFVH